ncbi:hypothetical protein IPL68_06025 [Candidatus Saccharibacteria bacterium]|nr:MAG: hypothetical protein IPL68_06025 [Candidatus Saccharibacteria bacterium]
MAVETDQTKSNDTPIKSDASRANHPNKSIKKHRKLKVFGLIVFVLLLVPLLVAGWYGFVPGLSTLMGATKPRDLGVRYSAADLASYKQKTAVVLNDFTSAPDNPTKPGKKTIFADPKTVEGLNLTQSEITAAINDLGWLWMPLKNVQVRLGNDVVEISGNLNATYASEVVNFIGGVGYSQSDVDKAASWGKRFANNAAVYIKATGSVQNDQLSFRLQQIQIGRYNVPQDIASRVLSTGTSNSIARTQHLEVQSAKLQPGSLVFSGTYPTTVYVKR